MIRTKTGVLKELRPDRHMVKASGGKTGPDIKGQSTKTGSHQSPQPRPKQNLQERKMPALRGHPKAASLSFARRAASDHVGPRTQAAALPCEDPKDNEASTQMRARRVRLATSLEHLSGWWTARWRIETLQTAKPAQTKDGPDQPHRI